MQEWQHSSEREDSKLDANPCRQTATPMPERVIHDELDEIPVPRVNNHHRPAANVQKIQEIKKFAESSRRAGVELAQYALQMTTQSEKVLKLIEEL
ncbi:hypothetical protein ONZ45_g8517 [Pleurotus djamor]|nr:hypothetical protein ONZ45_g8517 [Pleurotus djamor]